MLITIRNHQIYEEDDDYEDEELDADTIESRMIKNNLSIGKKKENLRKRMLAERRALSAENLF